MGVNLLVEVEAEAVVRAERRDLLAVVTTKGDAGVQRFNLVAATSLCN